MGAMSSSAVPESDIEGYQVLHVYEKSPAKMVGFEAFFDFIIEFCGVALTGNDDAFLDLLKKTKKRVVELKVFSLRTNTFRNVQIIPSIDSDGEISLGLTIRFRAIKDTYDYIHRVLEVLPDSPAEHAGLRPFSDYIIGAETEEPENMNFTELIEKYDLQQIKLFVYNSEENTSRAVIIEPNSHWMCDNSIGCNIGTGYMHCNPSNFNRLPRKSQSVQYSVPFTHAETGRSNISKSLPTLTDFKKAYGHPARFDEDVAVARVVQKDQEETAI